MLIDNMWATHEETDIRKAWAAAMEEMSDRAYRFIPVPMEEQCLTVVDNPQKGKNMFALGLLAWIYDRDVEKIKEQIAETFRKKAREVYDSNVQLLELGYRWAEEHLDFRITVPTMAAAGPMVVMNGNQAIAIGAIASGMELCAMYPITPATSASHYLSDLFGKFGGVVHQAEDEIAAAGFDPVYGARPLKRAIQSQLENTLVKLILEGKFAAKDTIKVDCQNGVMKFEK